VEQGKEIGRIFFHLANMYVDIRFCKIDVVIIGDEGVNLSGPRQGADKDFFSSFIHLC
jgi:hypothetical protein